MNLLAETLEALTEMKRDPQSIIFIGSEDTGHCCTWEEFQVLADIEYDDGFGAQEIASDLIIVFSDGFKLERHEYDGSEYWVTQKPFIMPEITKPIVRLSVPESKIGWMTVEEIAKEIKSHE